MKNSKSVFYISIFISLMFFVFLLILHITGILVHDDILQALIIIFSILFGVLLIAVFIFMAVMPEIVFLLLPFLVSTATNIILLTVLYFLRKVLV